MPFLYFCRVIIAVRSVGEKVWLCFGVQAACRLGWAQLHLTSEKFILARSQCEMFDNVKLFNEPLYHYLVCRLEWKGCPIVQEPTLLSILVKKYGIGAIVMYSSQKHWRRNSGIIVAVTDEDESASWIVKLLQRCHCKFMIRFVGWWKVANHLLKYSKAPRAKTLDRCANIVLTFIYFGTCFAKVFCKLDIFVNRIVQFIPICKT